MNTYVFDQAWQRERERLSAVEYLFDSGSRRRLTGLGLSEGWHCLEVGFGAGSIALWLADQVGPSGRVIATDLDTRFLEGHGRANLDVRTHNIVTDPVDEAIFDLVHVRLVLTHLPNWRRVLDRLVGTLRPGGWLLLEEADFGGATAGALAKYVSAPASVRDAVARIFLGFETVLTESGADTTCACQLPAAFVDAGLTSVAAEVHAPVIAGGEEQWVRGSVEQVAGRLVTTGLVSAEDIEVFLTATADPATRYVPALMVSASGQRPSRSESAASSLAATGK